MTARTIDKAALLGGKKGQALPLAAITLLVMALGVIATLNLGQAIYEKIRLQNAADAAAYSLAAIEARAFNFVALTNRTQIVHYNAAMAAAAYMTYAGYCIAIMGVIRDLAFDLADVDLWWCKKLPSHPCFRCPYCAAYPGLKAIAEGIQGIMKGLMIAYEGVGPFPTGVHPVATNFIEALGLMNRYIVWHMQLARLAEVNAYIIMGMEDVIKRMYPKNGFTLDDNVLINRFLNALLNSLEFRQTFDRGAGVNPGIFDLVLFGFQDYDKFNKRETPENRDAVRLMTELANASRSHKAIYNRKDSANFFLGLYNMHGSKMGATKILPKGVKPTPPQIKELRKGPYNYLQGEVIASDDYLDDGWGFAIAPVFGIVGPPVVVFRESAMKAVGDAVVSAPKEEDQYHYKYLNPSGTAAPKGTSGVWTWGSFVHSPKKSFGTKKCKGVREHEFYGIAPYFKFNTRVVFGSRSTVKDYNQPSVWMFLNISPERMQTKGKNRKPWFYKFDWNNGSEHASLDTTIGGDRNSFLLEGLTVISRAQVYYHRPDNWGEHPNMFNPFWRAKLAPVGEKLTRLFDDMTKGISGNPDDEDESVLKKAFLNGLRNLLNDVFFSVVTSIIAH